MSPNIPKPSPHGGTTDPDSDERDIDVLNDDDYDEIPLQHKRPFGAGLYRKPMINFVPANENHNVSNPSPDQSKEPSIAEIYLALVSKKKPSPSSPNTEPSKTETEAENEDSQSESTTLCEVCKIQVAPSERLAHITSIPHQSRLPHSHPPWGLNRSRMGLSVLSNQGWDPDSRKGLGASQQGIQFPLKPRPKEDKLGIGLKPAPPGTVAKTTEKKIVGRGQARKLYKEEKRKAARIRMELSGGGDKLERYLNKGSLDQPPRRQLQPGRQIHFDFSKKK